MVVLTRRIASQTAVAVATLALVSVTLFGSLQGSTRPVAASASHQALDFGPPAIPPDRPEDMVAPSTADLDPGSVPLLAATTPTPAPRSGLPPSAGAPAPVTTPTPELTPTLTPPSRLPRRTPTPELTPRQIKRPRRLVFTARDIVHEIWTEAGYGYELNVVDAIVQCESRWNTGATGSHGEAGLFQIHPINWSLFRGANPWDVRANTEVALAMRRQLGWRPWSCARRLFGAGARRPGAVTKPAVAREP